MTSNHARLRRRKKAAVDRVREKIREVMDIEAQYNGIAARGLTGVYNKREVKAWRELLKVSIYELGVEVLEAKRLDVSIDAMIRETENAPEESTSEES